MNTNTLYINKIKSSVFNGLELDTDIDHIIIDKLKYDTNIIIPVFIKSIHIKMLKEEDMVFKKKLLSIIPKRVNQIYLNAYQSNERIFNTLKYLTKIPFDTRLIFGGFTPDNDIFYYQ